MSRREKLRKMLEENPDDVFLNFGLAMELAKEGATQAAIAQFNRVLELDGRYLAAHFQKGSTLIAAARIEEARAALSSGVDAARAAGDPHAESEMRALLDSLVYTPRGLN